MKINTRVYAIILFGEKILVCNETINSYQATKFPGGGVEKGESPEEALNREIKEELNLCSKIKCVVHSPGTLMSPWNNKKYTPIYYLVEVNGNPDVPENENLTIDYLTKEEILKKENIAIPEKTAIKKLIKKNLIK